MSPERLVQLEAIAKGQGIVVLRFSAGDRVLAEAGLFYVRSGGMVGDMPIDVRNAAKLQRAAEPLNAMLTELLS